MKFVTLFLSIVISCGIYAQTPEKLQMALPKISGWTIDQNIEVFNPSNLFERINGAAEGYLLYNFQELSVFVYNQGDNYITIQVYRHATLPDAFGIYSAERPTEGNFQPIGAEGYQEVTMLNFFVDQLYVKIESPLSDDATAKIVEQIADNFAKNINKKPVFPAMLQKFPQKNKIAHTEQYISKAYLGHDFFNKAFTVNYLLDGKKYQMFIIDAGSTSEAQSMLKRYYEFTKQEGLQEGRLTIKDRFNGNIECLWKGQFICGIFNDSGAQVPYDQLLTEVTKNL